MSGLFEDFLILLIIVEGFQFNQNDNELFLTFFLTFSSKIEPPPKDKTNSFSLESRSDKIVLTSIALKYFSPLSLKIWLIVCFSIVSIF